MDKVKIGKYKHYKGNMYEVLYIGKHSETMEDVVIYKALYGNNQIWVRPLKMFIEEIIIDNKKIKRFEYIGE